MWGRAGHLDLDKESVSLYNSCGSQANPTDLDYPSRFSPLAPTETVCGSLDYGAHRSISPANTTTSFSVELCGLHAPGPMEAVSTSPQAPT
jgi:hypothetical protein